MTIVNLSMFSELFNETRFFGLSSAIFLALIFITMVIISREPAYWKVLFFPIALTWIVIGIKPGYGMNAIICISALLFVNETLTFQTLYGTISSIPKIVSETKENIIQKREQTQRLLGSEMGLNQKRQSYFTYRKNKYLGKNKLPEKYAEFKEAQHNYRMKNNLPYRTAYNIKESTSNTIRELPTLTRRKLNKLLSGNKIKESLNYAKKKKKEEPIEWQTRDFGE